MAGICASPARSQVTFSSAIDLALNNSPKIKSAQNDVQRAMAALSVTKDIYVPSVVATGGLGDAYGIMLSVPTIFTINAQSLVYSAQQRFYIRAAHSDLKAAQLALEEARGQVEEDAAVTYLSLVHAQNSMAAVAAQYDLAQKLVNIVQDRVNGKLDSELELMKARRTAVQLKLQKIRAENDIASLRDHLRVLTGLSTQGLLVATDNIPAMPSPSSMSIPANATLPDSPGILSAKANADAKRLRAEGDSKYTWRPQVTFAAQYGRISPIENVSEFYNLHNEYNTASAGVQIQLPMIDRVRKAAARASTEDALRSETDLTGLQQGQEEDRMKLMRSLNELSAIAELAQVELDIAQNELNSTEIEVKESNGGPVLTPKDEVNVQMQERQKYLDLQDAKFQLDKSMILFLRQQGALDKWIQTGGTTPSATSKVSAD